MIDHRYEPRGLRPERRSLLGRIARSDIVMFPALTLYGGGLIVVFLLSLAMIIAMLVFMSVHVPSLFTVWTIAAVVGVLVMSAAVYKAFMRAYNRAIDISYESEYRETHRRTHEADDGRRSNRSIGSED